MRLTFLLDENILYHAIHGVDEHDDPDATALELVVAIASICHRLSSPRPMFERYMKIVQRLQGNPPRSQTPLKFVKQLLFNSQKLIYESQLLPKLPTGVKVPEEDVVVVQAAISSANHPIVVANDKGLREAINSQSALGLRALSAQEALDLARSELP